MKRDTAREWTVEEFDDWAAASDRFDAVGQAADEEGGPSLSLVPTTERGEVWPTDLLAPAPERGVAAEQRAGREAARTAGRQVRAAEPDRRHGMARVGMPRIPKIAPGGAIDLAMVP